MSPVRRVLPTFVVAIAAVFVVTLALAQDEGDPKQPPAPDFNRAVRPILSENCFTCHGPDAGQRQADLRLDLKSDLFSEERGYDIVVPGDADQSLLYARITQTDEEYRMPPVGSGKSLTPEQIKALREWIDAGAKWKEHWSFTPPERSDPPATAYADRVRNAIDNFVFKRLEQEGLKPSRETDKRTLIRRLSFDLTGLPPTLDEIDAFVSDDSPDAYDNLITRLLSKPAYGEHMARYWLDAARYADTHGLHLDNYREMWPYRDWVIDAFNANMPFDQFTIEQLAGDLLPEPTLDQKIATGFNRCNVTTSEGGAIDEEFYVRYAVDRASTTGTVWMGLTVGCAQCHDHKYDPISQKEFYQLFAYFNNVTEPAMDGNRKDTPPVVKVPTEEQDTRLDEFDAEIEQINAEIRDPEMPEIDAAQTAWERTQPEWTTMKPHAYSSQGGATLTLLDDNSILTSGETPDKDVYEVAAELPRGEFTAIRVEALTDESLPNGASGRASNGNSVLSEFEAETASGDKPEEWTPIKFTEAWADYEQSNAFVIGNALDGKADTGWALGGHARQEDRHAVFLADEPFSVENTGRIRFRLKHESGSAKHSFGRFRIALTQAGLYEPLGAVVKLDGWREIGPFTARHPGAAYRRAFQPEREAVNTGKTFEIEEQEYSWEKRYEWDDGSIPVAASAEPAASYLYRNARSDTRQRATAIISTARPFKLRVNRNEVYVAPYGSAAPASHHRVQFTLQPGNNELVLKVVHAEADSTLSFELATETAIVPASVVDAATLTEAERDEAQRDALRVYYRENVSDDPTLRGLVAQRDDKQTQRNELDAEIATTLVMEEREERRPAHVLERGAYDHPGEEVTPDTPAILPPLPEDAEPSRIALAKWLVDPNHPLTARVTVNRLWQRVFGTGIVKTAEDFGSQGEPPTHPELLDWLATEFVQSGWDMRHMLRLIVSSSTYRQSSAVTDELLARDPDNRLYGRAPRFRLDAEMIRDQALTLAGLLRPTIGGPSVKPPQPDGLWKAVGYVGSNTDTFVADTEPDEIFRRSLYTFWKRTAPPPQMNLLDAPSREACTVRRERTNTPMQALMLMNDEQFFNAARVFAERIVTEGGETSEERVAFGFEAATARPPTEEEASILLEALQTERAAFGERLESADAIAGETTLEIEPAELAAWTMVANLILNLDEVLNKG